MTIMTLSQYSHLSHYSQSGRTFEKELIHTGKSQQRKGRNGERELAGILRDGGCSVRPGAALNYGKEPDLVGLAGIHVECKRCEQLRLSEWMKQAAEDAERFGDGLPALFHRRNRSPWLVTMELPAGLTLYHSYRPPPDIHSKEETGGT